MTTPQRSARELDHLCRWDPLEMTAWRPFPTRVRRSLLLIAALVAMAATLELLPWAIL